METGYLTPLLDLLKRGQLDRDIRLTAAEGTLGLRADEQRGVLELLVSDSDPEIAAAAAATLAAGVADAAPDVPEAREEEKDQQVADTGVVQAAQEKGLLEKLAAMNPAQRLGRAMKGTREERAPPC
jgi:hypothetical protein